MIKRIYEGIYYSIYQYCDKKAWYVSSSPQSWAVLLYSFYIYIYIAGMALVFGGLFSLDLGGFTSGGSLTSFLPEEVASLWLYLLLISINYFYFMRRAYWKEIISDFDMTSKNKKLIIYIFVWIGFSLGLIIFFGGIFFYEDIYFSSK